MKDPAAYAAPQLVRPGAAGYYVSAQPGGAGRSGTAQQDLTTYQIAGRISSARSIGDPPPQANAAWNSGRFESGPMTR